MFVLRVLTPLLELSEPETHKSISVSAATTPSISIPDILLTTMTTSKDLITGAINLYALGMMLVVVLLDLLIVIALFYIGISTHTAIFTRIILATSTSIVKLLFDVTILKWFLKNDYEHIIILGFHMLWFLNLLNIFCLLKSLELVDFTLWSVIYLNFVAVLIVIGQLRRQDKKKAMVQENGDGKDYFAYTLIVV